MMAQRTSNEEHRAMLKKMAETWEMLAKNREKKLAIEKFLHE